jgi:hypothetical protein
MTNGPEVKAMRYVRKWAKEHRITPRDMSRKGLGYDYLFVYHDGRTEKVEVKGVSKPYGIPDMRLNEFRNKRLKADYLMVVGNATSPRRERLYRIPRNAIKPKNLKLLQTYRIIRFQGKKNMEKYRVKKKRAV